DTMTKLATSINRLAFDLFPKLSRAQPGNLVFSPASISFALSMTWGGADGQTAKEMQQVLHFESSSSEVMEASGKLIAALTDRSRPITFRVANQLFGEKTYPFEPSFLSQTARAFGAPMQQVNFKTAHEPTRRLINEWVEQQTENRIQNLIPNRGVDSETRLVLVNAVYFLGDWAAPFDKQRTQPNPFHLSPSNTISVPTMSRTGSYRIASKDGVTALELPYEGNDLSMIIVLPDAVDGLDAALSSMDETRWRELTNGLSHESVWVSIPSFKLEPSAPMRLSTPLRELGMRTAFDRRNANFSKIANPPNPQDRLYISEVFHKGFIRTDEKGTEAAAATAVTMARTASAILRPRAFKADHPFVFVVRDNETNLILFLGIVADPSKT
ncbi:MAG TPA: serpin family protein, partial [Polyangiaceae bacterium]|nr:serpin family protein [Polyangiaceae bacterium]